MTDTTAFGQAGIENGAFGVAQAQVARVEFVIDSHRVTGEFRYGGPRRRLVDILNALDAGYATIYGGSLSSSQRPDDEVEQFEIAQVRREAILYAVPVGDIPPPGSSVESVRKVPVPTCIALPGYDITGNCFHAPEADPTVVPMLAGRNFVPMTEAVITPTLKGKATRQDLVIVNLARVLVYALGSRGN